ncbi:MAG: acyl-CoA dehydrogenase family protein [Acidimicrobiia bacterium]
MDVEQFDTPEMAAFRTEVRTWAEANAPGDWQNRFGPDQDEERQAFMAEHAAKLRDVGWIAPHWPVEYGGAGLNSSLQMVLKEEFQRVNFPPAASGIGFHHAAATLIMHGTPEQQEHLAAILQGEVWCQGFSEPNAGSDLASLQCRAVRDGDTYVLNGQKIWSSGAHHASWCLLLARTDPEAPKHKGISVFMLDMSLPGLEVRQIKQATGSSEFCEIFLTDVRVPADCLLGAENDGWRIAQTTLSTERGSMIIDNYIQLTKAIERLCREAATVTLENGRTAIEDPAIRSELGDRAAEIEVLGMLAEQVVGKLIRHGEMGPEGSILKLFYSEMSQRLSELATRVRGVRAAVLPDSGAGEWGRAGGSLNDHLGSWVWTIAAGSNEIQRNIIGERVLGLPREPALN